MADGYLLGYDIGSSSIKATLMEAETKKVVAATSSPKNELEIMARKPGWAEQDPAIWWEHVKKATVEIRQRSHADGQDIAAIGLSYQMHGLVMVDKNQKVLSPAIIWCDSRAVEIGNRAFTDLGKKKCLHHLLNSPGNFTASKLKWVMENQPEVYQKIHKVMLPGDYIAMRMTGDIKTTPSGLSEAILWDFRNHGLAAFLLDYYGTTRDLIPEVVPTFSVQGELSPSAAAELGLKPGIRISYRAGDQPNNALCLQAVNPGDVAATAGTSGVIYGVDDKPLYDDQSRVNTFVHVNYTKQRPRYGILVCINGTGSLNRWAKHAFMTGAKEADGYETMNAMALQVPPGAEGLMILPYGNGAERTLENRNINASIHGIEFNIHTRSHLCRAVQEGIVCALNHGLDIMRHMGITVSVVRAGNTNMFLSPVFSEIFAAMTGTMLEIYDTEGSQGAALGAGIGAGLYRDFSEAFSNQKALRKIEPDNALRTAYKDIYQNWVQVLQRRQANQQAEAGGI